MKKLRWSILLMLVAGTLSLHGAPGDGIRVSGDALVASPFAGVGITHDSNALTGTNEIDDIFYDLTAGFDLQGNASWGTASLRAWFQDRNYDETAERDSDNVRETFAATIGDADSVEASLSQRYSKSTDYSFDERSVGLTPLDRKAYDITLLEGATIAAEREEQAYGVDLRHAFTKLDLTVGADYSSVAYETETLNDWDEIMGGVSAGYVLSPKTMAVLDLEGSRQDSDALADTATFTSARAGVHYAATAKVDVRATVGYMLNDAGQTEEGEKLEEDGLAYDIQGSWQISGKVLTQISASSGIVPSEIYTGNIKRLDQVSLALVFGLTDRFDASVSAQMRNDAYVLVIDDEVSPDQETVGGIATLTYRAPGDFLTIALQARHDIFDSDLEDDFDVTRVGLTANVRY